MGGSARRGAGARGVHVRPGPAGSSVRFQVRVQPRASRTELAGRYGEAVRIRLAAPPADGAANRELVEFLARELGVPKSAVRIVHGATSRSKLVEVDGTTAARVRALVS